jgi:dTDP-glucose pyrophosphorylase
MTGASQAIWQRALLPTDSTIQQAIQNLNQAGIQIVLVITPDGRLVGTITDGDIRRGLLRGLDLSSRIDTIVHRDALVVPPEMGRDTVTQLMRANRIHQLPVVDEDRHVVGLHLWDEIGAPQERDNMMVIMAGGLGTRLRPHTETIPKPLLQVAGKPMLEHIIERARAEGFVHFVMAICYLGHKIEEYFSTGDRWRVRIEYLRENSPLGTAGALSLLDPRPALPFIVTNGDVLTDIRYGELLDIRHAAAATMAVRLHEWQHPFGVVQTRGLDIVGFEEKPIARTQINAGVYSLDPATLGELNRNERCDMPALFEQLQRKGLRTLAYPMHEPWLDIGRPDDLNRASTEVGG